MATGIGTILELRLEPDGLSARITCPLSLRPAPGQYLIASGPDPAETLPMVLFPSRVEVISSEPQGGQLILQTVPGLVTTPLPATWLAGTRLALRGPLGSGFHLPGSVRRVAIASLEGSPARLLPLASQALAQRAAVALYAAAIPDGLPEEVEVLPLDLLPEAPTWADFMALEVDLHHLTALRSRLGLPLFQRPPCQIEVLVLTAVPCSGLAECGVCAVATRDGWALACSDGPVFDFIQLEGV